MTQLEHSHGKYFISDDPTRLRPIEIHAYLTRSYWCENIPLEVVARSLRHSLCIGAYGMDGEQIGLVRVISDYATYAYLCDVYVLEEHRQQGLAKAMLALAMRHPHLHGLRTWNLRTRDAHPLYAALGFQAIDNAGDYMILRFPDVYRPVPDDE